MYSNLLKEATAIKKRHFNNRNYFAAAVAAYEFLSISIMSIFKLSSGSFPICTNCRSKECSNSNAECIHTWYVKNTSTWIPVLRFRIVWWHYAL